MSNRHNSLLAFLYAAAIVGGSLALLSLDRERSSVSVPKTDALNFGGFQSDVESVLVEAKRAHGSGVYIGKLQVVTAAHVAIESGDGTVSITFDGFEPVKGKVQWLDEKSDVALIKLDAHPVDAHKTVLVPPAADLACSEPDVQVGDELETIGNPMSMRQVHTWGRVAASVAPQTVAMDGRIEFIADLTVAPGSSGGPVFTRDGKVAGLADALVVAPLGFMGASLIPLTYVVPKSVICKQLAMEHPAPTWPSPTAEDAPTPKHTIKRKHV